MNHVLSFGNGLGRHLMAFVHPAGAAIVRLLILGTVHQFLVGGDVPEPMALCWYPMRSAASIGDDASGHGHRATSVVGVAFDDRDPGRDHAALFAGTSRIDVPAALHADLTLSLWVKTSQAAPAKHWDAAPLLIGTCRSEHQLDVGLTLIAGHPAIGIGESDVQIESPTVISDGSWHHLAASRDAGSGDVVIYVDGRREVSHGGPVGARTVSSLLAIGGMAGGPGFTGRLDDVRVFDHALNAGEITRLAHGETHIESVARDTMSDTWVGGDALSRTLPGPAEAGPAKSGRMVGIFYFLWLGSHGPDRVFDISQLLKADPANPLYGPEGAFHWWGRPALDYYRSNDEWVIRKHCQMLVDAGVDAIFCDVTNGFTYDSEILALCRTYRRIRAAGGRTPLIAFVTWSGSPRVVKHLHDAFYAPGLYSELWLRWQGKPLILAPPTDPGGTHEAQDPAVLAAFTVRQSWAWTKGQGWWGDGKDRWAWIDRFPQQSGWHDRPDLPEEMPVGVAGHPVDNLGRSYHAGKEPEGAARLTAEGACFAEQWRRALDVGPQFVFVTGWNEWVAQRFTKKKGQGAPHMLGQELHDGGSFFVDEYDQEFSRDAEPMHGGHGDDFLCQLAANIRLYKGVRPLPTPSQPTHIPMTGDFKAWQAVEPEYRDDLEDDRHRDHPGFGSSGMLSDASGRNDLDTMKVARDDDNLYFYARTRRTLSPTTDHNWMMLLLDVDGDHRNGWLGYDFIVNRQIKGNTALLERCLGGWRFATVGEVALVVRDNELEIRIPRSLLGLERAKGAMKFDFKWADNIPDNAEATDFYLHGDVAPNGRYNYRFSE
jgi:hypothetical protein